MAKKIFKYLIPVYILWVIVHIIFFFSYAFSQIGKETYNINTAILLFMSQFLMIACGIAFTIYMIVDCALRKFNEDSNKILWIIILILTSFIGAIIYYYVHGKNPRK